MKLRKLPIFTALLAVVALLTGCMKIEANITLHEDDTASGYMIMAFENDVLEMLGSDVDDALDEMGLADDVPEGATVEPYEHGTYTGYRYLFEKSPIDTTVSGDMSVTRDGDTFVVDGEVDLTDDEGAEEFLSGMD